MVRVTSEGKVTIPGEVREELGVEPGDEVTFEPTEQGYAIRKTDPKTEDGEDPFEKYRGNADSERTMHERIRRLRGRYPLHETDPD